VAFRKIFLLFGIAECDEFQKGCISTPPYCQGQNCEAAGTALVSLKDRFAWGPAFGLEVLASSRWKRRSSRERSSGP